MGSEFGVEGSEIHVQKARHQRWISRINAGIPDLISCSRYLGMVGEIGGRGCGEC